MKYYTKQWYNSMQKTDYTCGIKKIPDKKYKDTYATFVNEVYQTFLVSNKLFKYLVQSGIEEKKFRPVFTKNNKVEPLAYQLYM
ncbi:MAG: hypothetical protein Q4G58_11790 [bacterium]|nr:hypothetical protein [bacterium]